MFQHTAARRRLELAANAVTANKMFQHTAARRRLVEARNAVIHGRIVSTHSRPKAAGPGIKILGKRNIRFQHTAARRRLAL